MTAQVRPLTNTIDANGLPLRELRTVVDTLGKCRRSSTPDDWYPIGEKSFTAADARSLCQGCPVIAECLSLALRSELESGKAEFGVWGGTTERVRRTMRRKIAARRAARATAGGAA